MNFRSTSFKEGKKVDMFQYPLKWIRAFVKYRIKSCNAIYFKIYISI